MLPVIAGMAEACHYIQLFSIEMESHKFIPLLAWSLDPPDLNLLSS
jgi:hypothetical protein